MNSRQHAVQDPQGRTVLYTLFFGILAALAICLICRFDAGRPSGTLSVWKVDETAKPVILIEEIQKAKGFLKIAGGVPGMKAEPYRLRVGLVRVAGGDLLLLHTQMVRRADLKELYHCDDHCGFAATLSLRNLPSGVWRIALVSGAEGSETIWMTEEFVNAREEA